MGSEIEKDLVEKLKSSNSTEVYDALLKIRKSYVRNQYKMKKLEKYSVIKLIVPFIEHPKFCSVSLSIIADGCLEKSFVSEVIKCDGIKSLMRIMKSFVNDDIQNRACRALGNMAKFEIGFKAVHHLKPVSNIINFLSETNDVNCQQTAVRTLMILGKSSKTRELIARENGIVYIAKLLHSSNVQVLICSIKALANLTQNCSIFCARQLLELQFLKVLVELHSHSDKSVRSHALISLKNLSSQEEVRSGLIKVGAIKLFTEILSASESFEMSRLAALALCSCLDHIHMWSHNGTDRSVGLKALLVALKSKQFQGIHRHVIASLIPLSYESKLTDILLDLDVLQILIEILKIFIEKHKCVSIENTLFKSCICHKNLCFPHFKKEVELETPCSKKPENEISKNYNSYESFPMKNPMSPDKSQDNYSSPKDVSKWERSLYSFNSKTSDYSGSCNDTLDITYSPVQKYSTSLEINYDVDVGSPSTGHTSSGIWSPVSLVDENMPYGTTCWSPVVSTHSCSPTPENDFIDYEESEETRNLFTPSPNITSAILKLCNHEKEYETSVDCHHVDLPSFKSDAVDQEKYISRLKIKSNCDDNKCTEIHILSKKLKTENFGKNDVTELHSQISVNCDIVKNIDFDAKHISDNSKHSYICEQVNKSNSKDTTLNPLEILNMRQDLKTENINKNDAVGSPSPSLIIKDDVNLGCAAQNANYVSNDNRQSSNKLLNETFENHTIDHYIILFIFQLYFHLEKKTNSQIADKSCFSVLIDYICLIHSPSPKAEILLLNLIRNRYYLEKLILNGFISELEEKLSYPNYSCFHTFRVKRTYRNLINAGRQEVESDYGVGTLSHILVTSEKMGQLHALCAIPKLVTNKVLLYRLLFQANSLSLLISFLSENDISTQRKMVTSLCELYQSLTKEQKTEKCCILGTCSMKTSSKCYYKGSFLNVTFSVGGGSKILANCEKICENSEYFSALLKGHFLETNAELVYLPHISAENLATIFHFLHGCGTGGCCPYIKRIPFSVLLELLSDCEQFLLMNIKAFVEDRLCHRFHPPAIPKIYSQSRIYNSPALAKRALEFALSMDTSQKDVLWNCFEELINLDSNLNFFGDIEDLFKSIF